MTWAVNSPTKVQIFEIFSDVFPEKNFTREEEKNPEFVLLSSA